MSGRCATCKWWNQPFGQCLLLSESPLIDTEHENAVRPWIDREGQSVTKLARTQGVGQGSEGSFFETEPNFGCVHHEPNGNA